MARVKGRPVTVEAPAGAPPPAESAKIPPAELELPTAWRVLCARPGMWRGRRQWGADTLVPVADMAPETLEALHADATFTVVPVFGGGADAAAD